MRNECSHGKVGGNHCQKQEFTTDRERITVDILRPEDATEPLLPFTPTQCAAPSFPFSLLKPWEWEDSCKTPGKFSPSQNRKQQGFRHKLPLLRPVYDVCNSKLRFLNELLRKEVRVLESILNCLIHLFHQEPQPGYENENKI